VSSTGNVGIGTTNPSGKLDIEGGDVFIGTGTLTNASGSEDLSITGNLEVDGILYGDGSGLTGLSGVTASAIAYDDINNPDDISGINFGENTNVWTSTATTQDFFTINATSLTTGTAMVVTNTGGASSLSFKVEDETSDTTPFVITDDGNVGVGTTEPSAKFMVISTSDGAPSNGRDIFSVRGSALQLMFGINSVDQYGWIEAQQEGISSARDIVLNALGGKVGIGTTGPNRKLHVLSSGVIMDAESSSTSSYIDVIGTNNQLRIGTFGGVVGIGEGTSTIPDLAINSSGNVGIGTTSPGALLDVAGAEATDAEIILDADQGDDAADTWKIQSAASDNDLNIINDTSTLVTVQSDGKVGIGTTSPSAAMQIKGADDTWNSHIRLEDDTTTDYSVIIQDNQGMKFRTFTNNDNFYFRDNSNITIMMLEDGGNVGIGTTAPVSTLDINGSVSFSTVSKTADYTATDSDHVILVNSSSGNVTITLPAVSGVSGRVYIFKKTSADGNNVIIDGNASETIDGAVTKTFSTQYEVVTIISDGTVWWVL
ncbi:Phage tail fibers, partial [hydrothermal vent metagenome]